MHLVRKFEVQGVKGAQDLLNRFARHFPVAVGVASTRACEHFRRVLQTQYLSGQAIGKRSTNLYRSWYVQGTTKPPGGILGTPVEYAAAHNFGFNEKVRVKAHTRTKPLRRKPNESVRKYKSRRTKHQESNEKTVQVKAHSKRLNLRPRRFLESAVEAGSQVAERIIQKTLVNEIGNFKP